MGITLYDQQFVQTDNTSGNLQQETGWSAKMCKVSFLDAPLMLAIFPSVKIISI